MADDARISTALPRHPKTVKLQRRLGAQGCWSLLCLFLWVAENRPEGDLRGMTGEDIEIAANWQGDVGEFVRTLVEVRFLDGQDATYKIHDWAEHNPWAAGRPGRIEKARSAAGARWKSVRSATEPNAASMQGACTEYEQVMPTSPHLTSPPDTTVKPSSEQQTSSDKVNVSTQKKTAQAPSQEACSLAALLKSEILRNKPDYRITPAKVRNWEVTADRMLRIDGRTPEQIAELIRWAQRDEFWMANILSIDTLREKFDQLELRSKSRSSGHNTPGSTKLPVDYISAGERRRQEINAQAGGRQ
jgi:hypothetical protein